MKTIQSPDGCLLFDGPVRRNGYGATNHAGRAIDAHRLAWIEANGPIPPGMHVLHRCDVRNCVKTGPDSHLFLGTPKDNTQDMISKNRHYKGPRACLVGESNAMSKVSDADRQEIRERYRTTRISQAALGREYGISQTAVSHIVRRGGQ